MYARILLLHIYLRPHILRLYSTFAPFHSRPCDLIWEIKERLGPMVTDVRLNGSAAAYVISDFTREELHISDLDILFSVDFPPEEAHARFDGILRVCILCIYDYMITLMY